MAFGKLEKWCIVVLCFQSRHGCVFFLNLNLQLKFHTWFHISSICFIKKWSQCGPLNFEEFDASRIFFVDRYCDLVQRRVLLVSSLVSWDWLSQISTSLQERARMRQSSLYTDPLLIVRVSLWLAQRQQALSVSASWHGFDAHYLASRSSENEDIALYPLSESFDY